MDNLEFAKEVMPLYIDSAKTYAQTSIGALAFTIVFKEKVLGMSGRMKATVTLVCSWLFFLFAIGASVFYQWVAVRWIEHLRNLVKNPDDPLAFPLTHRLLQPGPVYGIMVGCFYIGSALLVVSSALQLFQHDPADTSTTSATAPNVRLSPVTRRSLLIVLALVGLGLLILVGIILFAPQGGQEM
jgi:hypothetical protein